MIIKVHPGKFLAGKHHTALPRMPRKGTRSSAGQELAVHTTNHRGIKE